MLSSKQNVQGLASKVRWDARDESISLHDLSYNG